MKFRSTDPSEQNEVRRLLQRVFQSSDEAPFLNNQHLRWKYYESREDSPGSRSYVLAENSRLTAHACAWPTSVLLPSKIATGFHPIDWAAITEAPGAGALLLREMRRLSDFSVCIGGTAVAQKVIASNGFRPLGQMKYYVLPLRPWLQARTHQRRNWKLPARLARNWWRSTRRSAAPSRWSAEPIRPEQLPLEVLPVSSATVTPCLRNTAQFHYWERCPIARHQLYLARELQKARGYFLLSWIAGQARLADAWVSGGEPAGWNALYALAAKVVFEAGDVAEIIAASAIDDGQRALEHSGFRTFRSLPVMVFDPKRLITDTPPIHWQMVDNDFSFLHQGKAEYET